ncbi:MAG: class I SAM-dependent methyltransferase [Actinobacteria bacterium]|nr:class I SAM-dependent methyltransferase [Actinomycetota bacterium]
MSYSESRFAPRPSPAAFPAAANLTTDVVTYGPDIDDEGSLRLLGHTDGRRVLVLGTGHGHNVVALARQGAHVIGVDSDLGNIEATRDLAEANEVRVELHQGDLAELAFVRADAIDIALSTFELGRVADLDRVLRQVNRVLRTGSAFTCSLPHPASLMLEESVTGTPRVARPYGDHTPLTVDDHRVHARGIAELFSSFGRANFRVDTLLEPVARQSATPSQFWAESMNQVPATIILRGRKDGI